MTTDIKQAPTVDVVVLGAGLAGHCAALEAADAGARVMLMEKMARYGGSTLMSAGSFALAGTDLQAQVGVQDTPEGLHAELTRISEGKADPSLVRLYVDHQLESYQWLLAQGVAFHSVSLSSGTAVPRTHPTDPRQLMDALHARVLAHPLIQYQSQAAATELIFDGTDRQVQGVAYIHKGQQLTVRIRRAVVIATGGFTRNRALVQKFAPELANTPAWGGEGNTGDGLTMAWALGADMLDMGYVTGTFGVAINHYPDLSVHEGDALFLRMAMYRGGIAVNVQAQRFADESQSYKKLAALCLAQPRAIAFQIFDQRVMEQSVPTPSVNDFQGALARGIVKQAATLRELAALIGLDADTLEATVSRYNEMLRQGEDTDFGRKTLGGGWGQPVTLDQGPWYALPSSAALLSTYCGLRVDTQMRVLDVHAQPISGLYAVGEVAGGFHGAGYMSGSSLGKSVIFGRIAGRAAVTGESSAP
jgi:fumarate reductase flavoprotein subunit